MARMLLNFVVMPLEVASGRDGVNMITTSVIWRELGRLYNDFIGNTDIKRGIQWFRGYELASCPLLGIPCAHRKGLACLYFSVFWA